MRIPPLKYRPLAKELRRRAEALDLKRSWPGAAVSTPPKAFRQTWGESIEKEGIDHVLDLTDTVWDEGDGVGFDDEDEEEWERLLASEGDDLAGMYESAFGNPLGAQADWQRSGAASPRELSIVRQMYANLNVSPPTAPPTTVPPFDEPTVIWGACYWSVFVLPGASGQTHTSNGAIQLPLAEYQARASWAIGMIRFLSAEWDTAWEYVYESGPSGVAPKTGWWEGKTLAVAQKAVSDGGYRPSPSSITV
jgi:hypothetical protein